MRRASVRASGRRAGRRPCSISQASTLRRSAASGGDRRDRMTRRLSCRRRPRDGTPGWRHRPRTMPRHPNHDLDERSLVAGPRLRETPRTPEIAPATRLRHVDVEDSDVLRPIRHGDPRAVVRASRRRRTAVSRRQWRAGAAPATEARGRRGRAHCPPEPHGAGSPRAAPWRTVPREQRRVPRTGTHRRTSHPT
jgi:hypothetical protein